MTQYFRPLAQYGASRPARAVPLAGGPSWFTHVERLDREGLSSVIPAQDVPPEDLAKLTEARAPIVGLELEQTLIMGILNVTPDSFSDGGQHDDFVAACAAAKRMMDEGADLVDIGGESTRPGAQFVPDEVEIQRTAPVIDALCKADPKIKISIDSRKASVTQAAFDAGAALANDVSGLSFDEGMAPLIASSGQPICVMHAQGTPDVMQENPTYASVLLDVYDDLKRQVGLLRNLGVPREKIIVDPGIGFGKTLDHNLELLKGLSLFHGLGCAVLLGVSRKRFIGTIGDAEDAQARAPGSIALALDAVRQGVQVLRVHDVKETHQALALWRSVTR